MGFKLKLVRPTKRRQLLKALKEFSQHDESRRWKPASKAERKNSVCQGHNPVEGISLLKANAAYHRVEVPDLVERAYARVTEPIVKPMKPVSASTEPAPAASAKAVGLPSCVVAAAARPSAGAPQVLLARTLSTHVSISDSGANLGLPNVGRKFLHNLRNLPQNEWVTVPGINSTDAIMLTRVADIYYSMPSVVCAHEHELPALFGHVGAGAKPLDCYMSSTVKVTVFVHKDLPEGLTILSLGKECREKQIKCVINGAPGSFSYFLTQPHRDERAGPVTTPPTPTPPQTQTPPPTPSLLPPPPPQRSQLPLAT
jgi:hypothetical protein